MSNSSEKNDSVLDLASERDNPETNESPSKQEILIPKNDNKPNEIKIEKEKVLKKEDNLKNLSSRAYLESTVVSTVMQGMAELANKKPDNPLEWLGNYIINESKKK